MNTSPKSLKFALIALASIILAACGGGGGGSDPVVNSAPTFGDSSVSIEVAENTSAVIYTAQASDANGNSITYSLSGGADQGKFNIGASSGEVRFVNAPDYEAPDDNGGDRTYEVQISASDSLASSSMSLSVSITNVVEDGEGSNRAPTAKISVIPEPASTTLTTATEITLDGGGSSDPDGDTLEYVWSQPSGQGIELSSLSSVSISFTAAEAGTYTFTLTVDDGEFANSAEVTLNIEQANRAPTAKISVIPEPASTTLSTATEITLDGGGSSDPDGDTLEYTWSQPTGQGIELSSLSNASTSFTAAEAGTYTFTLTVDDGEFANSAEVTLNIEQANSAPTAKISVSPEPASTTLTTATEITLNGGGSSDPDGDTLEYVWSQPSGQGIELSSLSSASTSFTAAEAGTYSFTLTVDDGEFASSAEVTLEITQANSAPTAKISVSPEPASTTLTTATEITLNGSGSSDPDGDTLEYVWSQPTGQGIELSSLSSVSTSFTAADAGTYTFTLTVDDGEFANSAEVTLNIVQANRAPTAKISVSPEPASTLLTTATEISLDGGGSSDPDGDTLEYVWSQPTGQGIELSSLNSASTRFTAAEAGTYTFTLTVDDGEFDDSADIEIEVQEPEVFPTNLFGFGQVLVNSSAERSFEFSNDGDSSNSYSLSFSSEVSSAFSADQPSFSLEAGESTLVTITFAPVGVTEVTTYEGTVSILDSLNETAGGYDLRGAAVLAYDDTGIYQEQTIWWRQNYDFGGDDVVDRFRYNWYAVASPDGEQVFVTSQGGEALVVFDRDRYSGLLRYRAMYQYAAGDYGEFDHFIGLAVSADGSQVFVTGWGYGTLAVFDRDANGDLTLRTVFEDGVDGLFRALGVALSPNDSQVFVVADEDDALVVFDRDANGDLSYRTTFKDSVDSVEGLNGAQYVATSPDGRQVFVTGAYDNALVVFDRDVASGDLSYRETFVDGEDGVDGLYYPFGVLVSDDGSQIFVAGSDWNSGNDGALAIFSRDINSDDAISYQRTYKNGEDGVSGLSEPVTVSMSKDGTRLFVSSLDDGIVVFDRDIASGELSYRTWFSNGDNGINGFVGLGTSVSPDGSQLFVTGFDAHSLSVFRLP